MLHKDLGEHKTALPLAKRALDGFHRALGPTHARTLTALNNLALVKKATGDLGVAAELHVLP